MWDFLFWVFVLVVVGLVGAAVYVLARSYLAGASPRDVVFGPRVERRLDIVEQANLDGRRRLVLIRRDRVEHLIMTGGPVDVVIETDIDTRRERLGVGEAASSNGARPVA